MTTAVLIRDEGPDADLSLKMGEHTLLFETGELNEKYRAVARAELRETPEVVHDALEQLKKLLKAETDLYISLDNEELLIQFLRPCKFYPDSTFKKIQHYFRFNQKHSKLCDDLLPSKEKNIFLQELLTILPKRDQHGRRILLIESGAKWQPQKCSLDELFKGVMLMLQAAISEPVTQVTGGIVLIDMLGLSLAHVWQFTPSFANMVLEWIQECIPMRMKAVHIINQPFIFNMVFAVFKPFIKEKIRKRIHFHGTDRASLWKHVDASCLPEQFGGPIILPDHCGEKLYELFSYYEPRYKKRNDYGYVKNVKKSH